MHTTTGIKRQEGGRSGDTMWRYISMAVTTIRTAALGPATRRGRGTLIGVRSTAAELVGLRPITAAQEQKRGWCGWRAGRG
jgi:hypothetical protein